MPNGGSNGGAGGAGRAVVSLGYADATLNRPSALLTIVGVMSICFGVAGLVINCVFESVAVHRAQSSLAAPKQIQQLMAQRAQSMAAFAAAQSTTTRPSFRALKPEEIRGVVNYIDKELFARVSQLNEAQKKGLIDLLSTKGQGLVDPDVLLGSQVPGKLQMIQAWPSGNHSVLLAANHGSARNIYRTRLDEAGHLSAYPQAPQPAFVVNPTPGTTVVVNGPINLKGFHDRYVAAVISAVIYGISALLAILLMVAGVYAVRADHRGARLHVIYVATKLPLSVFACTSILSGYFASNMRLVGPREPVQILSCLYPVLLVILGMVYFRRRNGVVG